MKRLLSLLFVLLILASLCGCGKSADTESYDAAYAEEGYYWADEDYSEGYSDSYSDSGYVEESFSLGGNSTEALPADFDSDKIIYSCKANLETQDFDACCAQVQELITDVGGFLETSTVYGSDYDVNGNRSAYYVIRIPREQFDSVTQNLSSLGSVSYINTYAENVGAEYHDTESRLTVYRTEEDRLLAMLEQAETVEDMLNIEDRLAEVRYDIENLTTQLDSWDSLINYSTLTLSIDEVTEYSVDPELGYWAKIGANFVSTLKGVGSFFAGFFAFLIAALPVLVILAVIAFVVILLIRRRRKRRAAKKAATPAGESTAPNAENKE